MARTMMVLLFIGGLMTASFLVVRPFLPAVVWAATLVIATWPASGAGACRRPALAGEGPAADPLARAALAAPATPSGDSTL